MIINNNYAQFKNRVIDPNTVKFMQERDKKGPKHHKEAEISDKLKTQLSQLENRVNYKKSELSRVSASEVAVGSKVLILQKLSEIANKSLTPGISIDEQSDLVRKWGELKQRLKSLDDGIDVDKLDIENRPKDEIISFLENEFNNARMQDKSIKKIKEKLAKDLDELSLVAENYSAASNKAISGDLAKEKISIIREGINDNSSNIIEVQGNSNANDVQRLINN